MRLVVQRQRNAKLHIRSHHEYMRLPDDRAVLMCDDCMLEVFHVLLLVRAP